MLSAQCDVDTGTLNITCDAQGMGILLQIIGRLIAERASHFHLRAKSAGGVGTTFLDVDEASKVLNITQIIFDYTEGD